MDDLTFTFTLKIKYPTENTDKATTIKGKVDTTEKTSAQISEKILEIFNNMTSEIKKTGVKLNITNADLGDFFEGEN